MSFSIKRCVFLVTALLLFSTCKKTPPPDITPKPTPIPVAPVIPQGPDIYIAGASTTPTLTEAKYWKNGTAIALSGGTPSSVNSILVQGTDVYCIGYSTPTTGGQRAATVWKNGVPTILSGGYLSEAVAIVISGSDVYIVGYSAIGNPFSYYYTAVCWKNGVATTLVSTSGNLGNIYDLYATGVIILSTDVYVSGYAGLSNGDSVAMYWKNGTPVFLSNYYVGVVQAVRSKTTGIATNGTDIYICGSITPNGAAENAAYWKNGTLVSLGKTGEYSYLNAITISGKDVYLAGTVNNTQNYWINGALGYNQLPNNPISGTMYTFSKAIAVYGGDVYGLGEYYVFSAIGPNLYTSLSWKNGVSTNFTNTGHFNSIAVVAKQ